jgi:dihydroxy-acid dehydratase
MRGSLISREVIADSIELVASSHALDGPVFLVGCDKTLRPPRWRWGDSSSQLSSFTRNHHAGANWRPRSGNRRAIFAALGAYHAVPGGCRKDL